MALVLVGESMKKILLLISMVLITNIANAQTEFYTSVKVGAGDTTIYVDDDTKLGDYLEEQSGSGYKYSDSGLLWGISAAVGLDWSPTKMYIKQSPYDWFHLRLEGEFGYNNYREDGKLRYDYMITDEIKEKYDQFLILANGYADFKIDNVIPYVGMGIGYGLSKEEMKINESSDSVDDSGVVYALHLGIGYKYSDITTLDFGVRRVYAPTEDDGRYIFDMIRLGARFRI